MRCLAAPHPCTPITPRVSFFDPRCPCLQFWQRLGCDVRVFDPRGLPLRDPAIELHPKVQELRQLSDWSEGHVWSVAQGPVTRSPLPSRPRRPCLLAAFATRAIGRGERCVGGKGRASKGERWDLVDWLLTKRG